MHAIKHPERSASKRLASAEVLLTQRGMQETRGDFNEVIDDLSDLDDMRSYCGFTPTVDDADQH
jgi:hypothetical protein